jgi:large subunit ribosomal protein L25
MAKEVSLKASVRSGNGRSGSRKTRAAGMIPAIIYGAHTKPLSIQVSRTDVLRMFKHATSENMLVDLALDEKGKTNNRLAFIQEIQRHPIQDEILHMDFHEVRADEKLHARVQIVAIGEAEGVKTGGGTLEQVLHELEVECLPKDLPERVTIDVSALQIGGNIHAKELKLPPNVTALTHGDISVFTVLAPTVEEVAAPTEATAAEPEVIKQKKAEEGEEGAKEGKPEAKGEAKAAEGKGAAKPTDAKAGAKPADAKAGAKPAGKAEKK